MPENQIQPKKSKKKIWIIIGIVVLLLIICSFLFIFGLTYFLGSRGYEAKTQTKSLSKERSLSIPREPGTTKGLLKEFKETATPQAKEEKSIYPETTEKTAVGEAGETEQKIIKRGTLTLVVDKVSETAEKIADLAVSKNGFIQSSRISTAEDGTQSGTIIVRVPVTEYESSLSEIKSFAKTVKSEYSTGQDVTKEYVDLQADLKNYQAEEAQYLEILKKATTVEDILKVTQQLSIVRDKIERVQGEIKYLARQTDMSTITVYLSEETKFEIPTKEWKPLVTLKKAFRSWVRMLQRLVDILIWLIIFLGPPIIIILFLVWLVRRRRRKKKE